MIRMIFAFVILSLAASFAQEAAVTPLVEYFFYPHYTLERRAENLPGPVPAKASSGVDELSFTSPPVVFRQQQPTERLVNFFDPALLMRDVFSVEMLIMDHVNRPVGLVSTARSSANPWNVPVAVSYYEEEVKVAAGSLTNVIMSYDNKTPFKEYFHHIVLTGDGVQFRMYINGALVDEHETVPVELAEGAVLIPEIAAYLENEPYMELANMCNLFRYYDTALTEGQIESTWKAVQERIEKGILYPGMFHFTAGPALSYGTETTMNIVWETDRPASAVIQWGSASATDQHYELSLHEGYAGQTAVTGGSESPEGINQEPPACIKEFTITGLQPGQRYFYSIMAVSAEGDTIDSGVLSFKTEPTPDEAIRFAVFGDTEARPHINNIIAKRVWEERPDFMIDLGDITDGGNEENKFQWNYEYFQGMTQVLSRIPMFPVPGNGEGDLYWYNLYHKLPKPEAYYTFSYGNADFFMINSVPRESELLPGGEQYEWLKEQLEQSTATWKFAAHHYAPWTSDEDDYGNTYEGGSTYGDMSLREITRLYEQYDVDMVFYGHLHSYERTWPLYGDMVDTYDGVVYILAGGAGGNLEDFAPTRTWFSAKTFRGHHYTTVNIYDTKLSFRMYDLEGRLRDELEIDKTYEAENLKPDVSPSAAKLTGPIEVTMTSPMLNAEIRFTDDGSLPSKDDHLYAENVTVTNPGRITAALYKDGVRQGGYTRAYFEKPDQPEFTAVSRMFIEPFAVALAEDQVNAPVFYTIDGSEPTLNSKKFTTPVTVNETTTFKAACIYEKGFASDVTTLEFLKAEPAEPVDAEGLENGVSYRYYEGEWKYLPDFDTLAPIEEGAMPTFDIHSLKRTPDHWGVVFEGYISAPETGVYTFIVGSDDGTRLFVGDKHVIENDGSHAVIVKSGQAALKKGMHPFKLLYFEDHGGETLKVGIEGPGIEKQLLPKGMIYTKK